MSVNWNAEAFMNDARRNVDSRRALEVSLCTLFEHLGDAIKDQNKEAAEAFALAIVQTNERIDKLKGGRA